MVKKGTTDKIRFRGQNVPISRADLEIVEDILALLIARAYAADNPQLFSPKTDSQKKGQEKLID